MQSLPLDTWEGFLARTILNKFEGSKLDCVKDFFYSRLLPAVWAIWLNEKKQEAPPRQ